MSPTTSKKLHALFNDVALALNESGIDVGTFLSGGSDVHVPWSSILVKEILWRQALHGIGKESTRDLSDEQAENLFDAIAVKIRKRCDVDVWDFINLNQ